VTLDDARELLDISKVTAVKVFDELEYFGMARRESIVGSRCRELKFQGTGRQLWEKALPLLVSPVSRIVGLEELPKELPVVEAGLTALASKTMLDAGAQRTFAVNEKPYRKEIDSLREIPAYDARILLECWKYDPELPGTRGGVDALSLYLAMREDGDERIQMALEELLGGFQW
jgi:hypothetical protein